MMAKRFSLIAAAMAVLAFAIPGVANATVLKEGGTPLGVPVTIVGTSNNLVTTNTVFGTIKCTSIKITAILTVNAGGQVGMTEDTGSNPGGCTGAGGGSLTVSGIKLTNFTSSTTTNSAVSFVFEVTKGTTTCKFTGTNVPATYVSGSSSVHVQGTLTAVAACKSGTPEIHGDLSLETTTGVGITVNQ